MKKDNSGQIKIKTKNLQVSYGQREALLGANVSISSCQVTSLIGPSGCGKSTFLRCINRMNDTIFGCKVTGEVFLDGQNIYAPEVDVVSLRVHVGMVFQKPNPFPKSVFQNVAYGVKINGLASDKTELEKIVTISLQRAGLYEEVKDRLDDPGTSLSGGQQQRLCIARALAVSPDVLLMDEPCSALDPVATAKIEELIKELRSYYTIVIVTHSMSQAARISDKVVFFLNGQVYEQGSVKKLFNNPDHEFTRNYIQGKIG